MARELTHDELQELLGAYSLDAVDRDEAEKVENDLSACPRCRSEVASHREAVAWMANAGAEAPPLLWERIASSLEEAPPALDLAKVHQLRPRLDARRAVSFRVAAGLVAAAAAVIGVLGIKVVDDGRRLDTLASASQRQHVLKAVNAALVDPTARRVGLRSKDQRFSADAVLLRDGTGYLVKSNLPALPAERAYQLWALVGTSRVSAAVLGSRVDRVAPAAFTVAGDLWGLAITEEQAGGVEGPPKGQPLVVGELRVERTERADVESPQPLEVA